MHELRGVGLPRERGRVAPRPAVPLPAQPALAVQVVHHRHDGGVGERALRAHARPSPRGRSSGRSALHSRSITVASRSPNGRERRGSDMGTSGLGTGCVSTDRSPGASPRRPLPCIGDGVTPRPRRRPPGGDAVVRTPLTRRGHLQGVQHDARRPGGRAAGPPRGRAGVLARPDPAEPRLVGDGGQAGEAAGHARVGRRGDGHALPVTPEGRPARSPRRRSARCARRGRTGRRRWA